MCTDIAVVVYLTVDGKDLLAVGRVQRLSTRLRVDDRKPLVCKDCGAAYINTAPVRSAMADFLCIFKALLLSSGVWDFMLKIPAIPHMVVVILEVDIGMMLVVSGETGSFVRWNGLFHALKRVVSPRGTESFMR